MSGLPLSPMLVQYLVGLCCLRWSADAVEVKLGEYIYDDAAEKERDVEVTVEVDAGPDERYAFMAYEVKREANPLDVKTVEQLAMKLKDMASITHRAIVSASGYTDGARKKAKKHGITLYQLEPWTKPLQEQFPALRMVGTADECFPTNKYLLCWLQPNLSIVARAATGPFEILDTDSLFNAKRKPQKKVPNVPATQGGTTFPLDGGALPARARQDGSKHVSDPGESSRWPSSRWTGLAAYAYPGHRR
jgi:hypothetical protein